MTGQKKKKKNPTTNTFPLCCPARFENIDWVRRISHGSIPVGHSVVIYTIVWLFLWAWPDKVAYGEANAVGRMYSPVRKPNNVHYNGPGYYRYKTHDGRGHAFRERRLL